MLKEKSAKIIVRIAEMTALHLSEKASVWTHFQPTEPEKLQKMMCLKRKRYHMLKINKCMIILVGIFIMTGCGSAATLQNAEEVIQIEDSENNCTLITEKDEEHAEVQIVETESADTEVIESEASASVIITALDMDSDEDIVKVVIIDGNTGDEIEVTDNTEINKIFTELSNLEVISQEKQQISGYLYRTTMYLESDQQVSVSIYESGIGIQDTVYNTSSTKALMDCFNNKN